ncbi:MAG: UTP--glucose-1-phosphate uridylyltransferase [Chitinivibrionia bacterium]|nr:UTP--glucose-1-phosphate uridylyltransferase [Chitinivibrionia bacterium]
MQNKAKLFQKKMTDNKYDERIINLFLKYYDKLQNGDKGIIGEEQILPVEYGSVEKFSKIPKDVNSSAKTAVIKLNGGLGTSMGMDFPKSFVEVRENKRFIDIALMQQENYPLIFMNSSATKKMTDEFISQNPQIKYKNIASGFIQHSFPKVVKETLEPAVFAQNPEYEFNPAGHGDVYMSLLTSGILAELLKDDFRFAFISNIDNTGAVFDASIANFMEKNNISFLMEVCRRGEMDKKGGHIAKTRDGHYVLRERAQSNADEIAEFENIEKYSYFNTNSVWVDLRKLSEILEKSGGIIELPFIANEKTLNPNDKNTAKVYQIEQAMGAAISLFDEARILEVEKERFFPVKTTNDLFLLRSDRFLLQNARIKSFDENKSQCNVVLNPKYYGNLRDFEKRLKNGAPKLKKCAEIIVNGDVYFDSNMEFEGEVKL